MMLKELTVKEALQLLAEKYPELIRGVFMDSSSSSIKVNGILSGVNALSTYCFIRVKNEADECDNYDTVFDRFAIEVPDKYRYMTQQEYADWLIIIGYKNHQIRFKGSTWKKPNDIPVHCFPQEYEYRTIQEVAGKIVYGEPQEFKIKVQS